MGKIESNQNCGNCPAPVEGICPMTLGIARSDCGVRGRLFTVKADQVIRPSGSVRTKDFILRSGLVRVQRYALDGRRHILSLVLPGEVLGSNRDDGMTYESVTDCVVCEVECRAPGARATALSDCAVPLYKQQMIQLERLQWMTWFIGTLVPEERICAFLGFAPRIMPAKTNADGSLDLTMLLGRTDLADFLGTTPETISRVTHKLQDSGILVIHTAQSFTILDLHQLIQRGHMPLYYYAQPLDDYGLAPHPGYAPPAPTNPA
jgi:CRP/FNR family transcriptional regulator